MLALVLPHGHAVGLVDEDVGRLEHRVGEEPHRDGGLLLLGRLVLELGHPPELAEGGQAAEDPRELGVLGHVGLGEERGPIGVDSRRDQDGGQVQRRGPQRGRVLGHRDGVEVHDHDERVVLVLIGHPLTDGADVVAQVHLTRRLDAGEHAWLVHVRQESPTFAAELATGAAGPASPP